ncbi:MAG: recombinase family protein, partial [Lachnospiraceae bacterium]|nr:recombinase family protein [Lachnospiraceae bacterium]
MARTKNRNHQSQATNQDNLIWSLGKYIRLSKEDLVRGKAGSNAVISNSVANQKKLLEEYYQGHIAEFGNAIEYIDDGYSGTDIDREGFQRLLADITSRKINCVIVKDLSRLSRNYSDAGRLIEDLFVRMRVRFISLSEGIDSYKNPDSISGLLVPITNVINDNFCYMTSRKIRQVLDYKRRNGDFIGSFAAYGYRKNPEDRHRLLVDEEAAEVVKGIYDWFLDGMSKNAIVHRLNAQGIACPSLYKRKQGTGYYNPHSGKQSLWSAKSVGDILKNRLYCGDMVQGRQRIRSYKIHKQESMPMSE